MQQLLDLASNSWADIAFSVHVWFAHKARAPHEQAIKCICWLVSQRHCRTRTHSFSYQEPKELIVNCYVDTDFAGLWGAKDEQSPLCVKSQTGCVAANPEWLSSTLGQQIADRDCPLNYGSWEYIALLQVMREVFPNWLQDQNSHIAIKYHFFWEHVFNGTVDIKWIDTSTNQKADIFTKGLSPEIFKCVQELLMGW